MNLMRLLLGLFFIKLEKLKGRKTVIAASNPNDKEFKLQASFNGFQLSVFCNRRKYRRNYDHWFIPDDKKTVYHLYCKIIDHEVNGVSLVSENMRKACELKIDLPALLPDVVDDDYQRVAAIHAYLDILNAKLDRINNKWE